MPRSSPRSTLKRANLEDISKSVGIMQTFEPDAGARDLYAGMYREFRAVHKQNKAIYARLNAHG